MKTMTEWTKIAGKRENNKKNANKSAIVKALAGETF